MSGLWWAWISGGILLGVIELFAPGFFFLGFASGAVATGLVLLAGGPLAVTLAESLPYTLLFFACVSLVSWLLLRWLVGVRKGQLKVWDRDINED